jgi:hypothetical protein
MSVYMYVYIYIHVCVYICTYIHVPGDIHVHILIYNTHTHRYTHKQFIELDIYPYIYISTSILCVFISFYNSDILYGGGVSGWRVAKSTTRYGRVTLKNAS